MCCEQVLVWDLKLSLCLFFHPHRSNDVWVLDLEQWAWSKPNISGPSPHPRGGQSQVMLPSLTLLHNPPEHRQLLPNRNQAWLNFQLPGSSLWLT